jgi:hypothetical protein
MAKFKFYQDLKIVTWNRVDFEVEASTREEAIEKMKSMQLDKVDVCSVINDNIDVIESDILWDTQEHLKVHENSGHPTIEVYENENGYADKLIFHNGL